MPASMHCVPQLVSGFWLQILSSYRNHRNLSSSSRILGNKTDVSKRNRPFEILIRPPFSSLLHCHLIPPYFNHGEIHRAMILIRFDVEAEYVFFSL
ncbi:hypothetical protein Nepgr_015930 [Nepenthes gracilis]|uniref:Uncharacterized protein n=1 Tax=Nepenthes gracilis TaxID=150966 RepID=A0AAD3SNM7_NEPGR|nr:hypothetical protein Nepgr_015930 [Nepenthes gracilis]